MQAPLIKLKRTGSIALTKAKSMSIPNPIPTKESISSHRIMYFKTDPDSPEVRQMVLKSKLITKTPVPLPIITEPRSPTSSSKELYFPNTPSPKKKFIIPNSRPLFKDPSSPTRKVNPHLYDKQITEMRELITEMKRAAQRTVEDEVNKERIKIRTTIVKKPSLKKGMTEIFDYDDLSEMTSQKADESNMIRLREDVGSKTTKLKKQVSFEDVF